MLNARDSASWTDTHDVKSAFDVLMQCRMLPMLLESFVGTFVRTECVSSARTTASEDMRRHQYLITNDVMRYMEEYEVRRLSCARPCFAWHLELDHCRPAGIPT